MPKAKPEIKLAVTFGDTHTGSKSGLFLNEPYEIVEAERRETVHPNAMQAWLWTAWETLWAKVNAYVGTDPWAAIHTGDAVHGNWSRFDDVMLPDMADQVKVAGLLLGPKLASATKKYMTRGTSVRSGRSSEATIAEGLAFERCPHSGTYAPDRWRLNLNGWPFIVKHHIPVTSREHLRLSAPGIELSNEQVAAVKRGHVPPLGLLAGHRHTHDLGTDGRNAVHVCGPWMLDNRHTHKAWGAMIPEPTLTVIDARGKASGDCPHFEVFKATPPQLPETQI